jgi:hypothetical protein
VNGRRVSACIEHMSNVCVCGNVHVYEAQIQGRPSRGWGIALRRITSWSSSMGLCSAVLMCMLWGKSWGGSGRSPAGGLVQTHWRLQLFEQ